MGLVEVLVASTLMAVALVVLLGSSNRFGEGAGLVEHGWQLYDQWAAAGRLADPKKML